MSKIRVLVVDDSVVIRRLVTDALSGDPEIDVVGTAANGSIALQKITQCNPDLITLDVEMPVLDGLATLELIRKDYPKLPVIMFSTLTQRGALTTIEALARGASDYVSKPSNVGSVSLGIQRVREDLIPKVKALCPRIGARPIAPITKPDLTKSVRPFVNTQVDDEKFDILAIGTSTGGPNALAAVLGSFPGALPVPVVIVQHMPPMFTRLLAERLDSKSGHRVVEAEEGMELKKGWAYVAPGDYHMEVMREAGRVVLRLNQAPPENSCRPAVDPLFRSVANVYGARTLAVVLTGMGQDGLRGCEALSAKGARIMIQDEASSIVWGMPGAVAEAHLAKKILPLDQIGPEISRLLMSRVSDPMVPPRPGLTPVGARPRSE